MMTTFQSRAPPPPHGYGHRPNGPMMQNQQLPGPPLDGVEHWFIQPAPNNRMVLALECGITSEVSWSLNRLLRLSASDKFIIGTFPTLPDLLCRWPEWFLEHYNDEDSVLFSPSPSFVINRQQALNSLLVLKNAAMGDEGAGVEARNPRIRALLFRIMHEFRVPTDSTLEFLLSAMDLFRYTVHKWPMAPTTEQIETLVGIVGCSNDRAILVSGWYSLHNLLDTFTTMLLVTPTSEALNAAIRALPVHVDQVLTAAALEYILAHVSHPSLAKAFLHHPGMPQVLRVLAHQLLHDQSKLIENVTTMLGVPPKTVIAQNNAIWMLELSRDELDELSTLTEPSRVTKWMQQVFEVTPNAEMTQVDFWNLYKGAFAVYGLDNMLPATDLIKLVTTIFPQANAMVLPGVNGKPPKFVIRGLERRRAAADNRTKCQWNRWGCEEPTFASPSLLYAHVKSHTALNPTTKCLWGSCTLESTTPALFEAHLLTHLPVQIHGPRHPGQTDDLIVPPHAESYVGTPTIRPTLPPPQQAMVFQKAIEDPPSTSFAALLIMRILYRTSFIQAEVVMKTDGNHFGFPGIEQPIADGEMETAGGVIVEDLGFDTLEGQKKGKAAFKAIAGMLEGVYIHDAAIAAWIDEMLDSIKALPDAL